jgi:cell division transport system permease protein
MTWFVIGIALALPLALAVVLEGADSLSRSWDDGAQLSVFLDKTVSDEQAKRLAEDLLQHTGVDAVKLVTRAQALEEFQQFSGFGDALRNLDNNPLPALVLVTPSGAAGQADTITGLALSLESEAGVDRVIVDLEWVQRLRSLMELGQRAVYALGSLFALGVLLIIGNTIRLSIEGRRDEIVVVKLVGGSDAFVRRPFLYTGMWYGLGGAVVAWLLVAVSLWWLRAPLLSLALQYQSSALAPSLSLIGAVQLLLFGASLGLIGAWVTVTRHLVEIEPR